MMQQAIVITKKITIPGQHEYFQLVLPKDVDWLVGLEYGFTEIAPPGPPRDFGLAARIEPGAEQFEVRWNYLKGQLTLMLPGCENIFFQEDILMDKNITQGETVSNVFWEPKPYSFMTKREEYSFRVARSSNLVEGIFKDAYRNDPGNFFPYILRLYLWTEKC